MKVVLLAGGRGTRISEESEVRPKPMIEIGGKPIIWHIMKIFSHYGFNDFIILTGYKSYSIKEYFSNYFLYQSDIKIDFSSNQMEILSSKAEPWKVTLLDTGLDTLTGGRLARARDYIGNERFMLTYGDGVANINLRELLAFHENHGKLATMTSVRPEGRFGALEFGLSGIVKSFKEKPEGADSWVNGGFFVCQPEVLDYIKNGDETILEREPLESLVEDGQLFSYQHSAFWYCMDNLRDKIALNNLWEKGCAPWKIWK